MEEVWRIMKLYRSMVVFVVMVFLFQLNMKQSQCSALNNEGLVLLEMKERVVKDPMKALWSWNDSEEENGSVVDSCSWFGVECSNGNVVTLNLKDLCLHGTLAPEIGKLTHIKSIILRNNSFFGEIPKEILQLEELEVLDLGHNNFSGTFPSNKFGIINPSLSTLLLDNNDNLGNLTPEVYKLKMISELHVQDEQLSGGFNTRETYVTRSNFRNTDQNGDLTSNKRQLLQTTKSANKHKTKRTNTKETVSPSPSPSHFPSSRSPNSDPFSASPLSFSPSESPSNSPSPLGSQEASPSPSPSSTFFAPSPSPSPIVAPPLDPPIVVITPTLSSWISAPSPPPSSTGSKPKHRSVVVWSTVGGFSFLVLVSAIGFVCFRSSKVVTVKPWATGLSGQLQKAFVTGVPSLKRAELEAACEDFSNIIGTLPDGTVYKGTLSSGVEIAVSSSAVTSSQNWNKTMESQFRKKIETLSRVNHKNFVNLIGYCEEKKPFTRMMVFEYAPNGTLFEHLHIREAEQLDWGMRMRIAMGIAYCLEHLHQLSPPIAHRNLLSSTVYLTEDYAAKLSDLSFWHEAKGSEATQILESTSDHVKGNVYSFGVILFELITGRIPFALDNGFLADWATEYIRGQPLRELVDSSLKSLKESEVDKWSEVVNNCVHPEPGKRPAMREVVARMKEITAMEPDGATPKSSPLWWAELEITSPI